MTKDGNFKRRVRRSARERGQRYTEALVSIQGGSGPADFESRLSEIDRYDWTSLIGLRAEIDGAETNPHDASHVRVLVRLYWRLGDHDAIVDALTELLESTLDVEDELSGRDTSASTTVRAPCSIVPVM